MRVLGIDTSTRVVGIAVVDGARVLATDAGEADARGEAGRRNTDLLVRIDDVCGRAGVPPRALDAIAIGAGPGSFTGLRIGMATAKGIAFAAGKPLWAVSSLAALADDARALAADDTVIVAALDARRGELYAGCYRAGAPLAPERLIAPDELAAWAAALAAGAPLAYAGDALRAYPALAPLDAAWLPVSTPSGRAVAQLALAGARADILTGGAPTYIRASEAELRYPDGVPGALRRR